MLNDGSSRQKLLQQNGERARYLRWQEMPALVDEFEPRARNFLRKLGRAGMRTHRVMATGDHHGGATNFRQHVQHIGARERAKGKAETDRIVGEVAPEIGFVSCAVAELQRIG